MALLPRVTFSAAVNYADATAPTLSSGIIPTTGDSISLLFSEIVTVGAGGNGGFTISMSGGAVTLNYSSGIGTNTLVYTTSRVIESGETCSDFDYTQPGNGIEDLAGNDLATFTNQQASVTNNSTESGASATATDTFNRANSDPMSTTMSDGVSTWTNGPGALGNPAIVSNAMNAPGTQRGAVVASPTFADDQTATITLTAQVGVGVMLRMQSGLASGYLVYLSNSTTIQFYRIADSGSIGLTQLGSNVTISSVTSGDTIGAEITGTTITALRNGVSVGTRTDATYTSGQPGIYMGGSGVTLDAFTASDL